MGIRDDITKELSEAFNTDLSDAVKDFEGRRQFTGGYNPTTGKYEDKEPLIYTGRGVFSSYKLENIDGTLIQAKDKKLTVLKAEITDTPEQGDTINSMEIISIGGDPADVAYTLQLRA